MLPNLPIYIPLLFAFTTLATLLLFIWVIKNATTETTRNKAIPILISLTLWLVMQLLLTINATYSSNTNLFPPKIMLFGILPAMLTILFLFATQSGRQFIDSLPLKNLTYVNIVRIPVELVLFWLFLNNTIPELMTFEGYNFDIIAGITAPFIAYWGFTKNKFPLPIILTWNVMCLGLLINIVVIALLSAPTPLQQLAFNQPNIAILYFPFSWLPTFIVPIVLFGHLTSIRQLLKQKTTNT